MPDFLRRYLVKNYGYDGGHSGLGPLIGLLLYAFGVPTHLAALLGGILYAIPKEVYDCIKARRLPSRDTVSDLISYQTSWPAVYLADQQQVAAIALLIVVTVTYIAAVVWKLEE